MMRQSPWSARLRFRLGLLALLLAGTGPGRGAPPAAAGDWRDQLAHHLAQPRFAGSVWGVQVVSLDSGRVLFEHEPGLRLSPASNTKLFTGALALDRLGGDYRIVTPVLATTPVAADGVLAGDVIVSGRGDPGWNPRRAGGDFAAAFAPFVAVLQRSGVRRITGDLVADATWLRTPPHGPGWTADDLSDYYGAEISAISLDENYVDVRVAPAAAAGRPAVIELQQPHSGLVVDNRTVTGPAGGPRLIRVLRLPGESRVLVEGEIPLDGPPGMVEATVPRPADWFATALRAALAREGIAVAGRARGVCWPEPPCPGDVRLGEVVSAPLRELVVSALKPSQNLKTGLLFAHLGELRRTAATPAWRRSDELAVEALGEFLAGAGIPAGSVVLEEGSGLSRNNLVTAAATVRLLQYMAAHREREAFRDALPVAGVDGTLRRRMQGTPAEGNARAKTGSLRWAGALSGYLTTAAGERLAFSLMLNRHLPSPDRAVRAELDEIVILLSGLAAREAATAGVAPSR